MYFPFLSGATESRLNSGEQRIAERFSSHTSTASTANRSPEPAGNREDHMATLADFNFAASMITGHILEVYPSLTGA